MTFTQAKCIPSFAVVTAIIFLLKNLTGKHFPSYIGCWNSTWYSVTGSRGEMGSGGEVQWQETCILMADSCCVEEANTTS